MPNPTPKVAMPAQTTPEARAAAAISALVPPRCLFLVMVSR